MMQQISYHQTRGLINNQYNYIRNQSTACFILISGQHTSLQFCLVERTPIIFGHTRTQRSSKFTRFSVKNPWSIRIYQRTKSYKKYFFNVSAMLAILGDIQVFRYWLTQYYRDQSTYKLLDNLQCTIYASRYWWWSCSILFTKQVWW